MTQRNNYISYLRVIATVFVILIHACTGYLNHFQDSNMNWNYANWVNSFTRCAVPIFVMISGALLLKKQEDTISFYRKRISKILLPLIFWTIIYLIYHFIQYTHFSTLAVNKIVEISVDKILHGANAHLWYLYMIIGLYLAIPYLRKIIIQSSLREIEIFLVIWLVSMILMNKLYYPVMPRFDLTFFSGYIGYLILGYYLSVKDWSLNKWFPFAVYGILGAFTAYMSYTLSKENNKYNPHWYYYIFPNIALMAAALFYGIKKISNEKHILPRWISLIDQYSFGIFLVHILPLNYLHPVLSKYMNKVAVVPIVTLLTLMASILIIHLLRLLPYGKKITG